MEKKKIVIVSLIILIIIIFISVYIFIRTQLTIKAIIVECFENSILVYDVNRRECISIGLPKNINLNFKQGQEVIIYLSYNTCTEYTSPASISSVFIKKIKIIKEDSTTQIQHILDQLTLRKKEILERL